MTVNMRKQITNTPWQYSVCAETGQPLAQQEMRHVFLIG